MWWKCSKCKKNLLDKNVYKAIYRNGKEFAYHRTSKHKACGLVYPTDTNPSEGSPT